MIILTSWEIKMVLDFTKFHETPRRLPTTYIPQSIKFGGLDLGKRVDASAFVCLELKERKLEQVGQHTWNHVNYAVVSDDIVEIQKKEKCRKIGFDRTGVGDAVAELFSPRIPLVPIDTTNMTKNHIINMIRALFQKDKLRITRNGDLFNQILEQQQDVTPAGNITYKHPSSSHDDLFWALGYACYVALPLVNRPKPITRSAGF